MNDEIGAACREMRHLLGMTQSELGDQVGCSRQGISDVERGRPTSHAVWLGPRIMKIAEEMLQQQRVVAPAAQERRSANEAPPMPEQDEVAEFVRTKRRSLESVSNNGFLTSRLNNEPSRSAEADRDFDKLAWRVGAKLVCDIIEYPFSEYHRFCHPGPWHVVRAYFESKGVAIHDDAPDLDLRTRANWPLHLVVREGHRRALLALSVGLAAADGCQDCVDYWLESLDAARAMFLTQNDSAGS
jgi:transcriptional regulator with XRE-family HTH domain